MKTGPLTVLDFETTGAVPGYRNEPWQIGWCCVENGELREDSVQGHFLRVGTRPFNRYAPGRHARLRDELKSAPALREFWSELAPILTGRPLVAHNIATEKAVLAEAFPMHPFGPWIDTLMLARRAWPGMRSYALEDLVPTLGLFGTVARLCPGQEPHDASYDAVAAAVLLCHLLRQPGWCDLSLEDLEALW